MSRYNRTVSCCAVLILLLAFAGPAVSAEEAATLGTSAEPEGLPATSRGALRFFVDAAGFRGPKGQSRLEFYTLLDARQLAFLQGKKSPVGEVELSVVLTDTAGSTVDQWSLVRRVSIDSLGILAGTSAPYRDAVGFDLSPGRYRATVSMVDAASGDAGTCETTVLVEDYDRKGLVFSDVQLASEVARSAKSGRFAKQGWKVVPNTTRHYLLGGPVAIYFELYNFTVGSEAGQESFILGYSLVDSSGQKAREYAAKRILKPGESCVKTESLDTEGLSEGTYTVQVEAFDGGSREYVRARRQVYLSQGEETEPLNQVQQDLLRYYSDIRYVANEKTLEAYGALPDWSSKMVFLRTFWKRLDPTRATPTNERLLEHMLRMGHADARFSGGPKRSGSDTDKGRVYVTRGPPDDIDYHTSAAGQKPYEVWLYYQKGDYQFIFRDRWGSGTFELVHSTYPGESQNPYWRDDL